MDKSTPIWMHLEELRNRLIRVALLFIVLCFVAFWQYEPILSWLLSPVKNLLPAGSSFIATDIVTGWIAAFKVALFAAFYITFPYALIEIWLFLSPGLKKTEKRAALPILFLLSLFFLIGGLFGYKLAMPMTVQFLIGIYDTSLIQYLPDIDIALNFVMRFVFGFGLLFETPFLMLALGASGAITHKQMSKARPFMIVVAFIVAAILTPPDVASQIVIAIPFCLLYEVGLIFVFVLNALQKQKN